MRSGITTRKDLWTGIIYIVLGVFALVIARNYALGSAARMGPGYFPTAVSALLIVVGCIIAGRSFFHDGASLDRIAWKPALFVLGAIVAFGFLITRAGLIVAALVLVLGCAAASEHFRLRWIAVLGLAALITFCIVVFIFGMGIPMPIVGPWLGGH